jgi:hypothetical protein
MKKLIGLITIVIILSSCSSLMSLDGYEVVTINGKVHSTDANCVEVWKQRKNYRFIFYQRDNLMQNIVAEAQDDLTYTKDKVIHFVFYSINGDYIIDASPRDIQLIFVADGTITKYENNLKCK